MIAAWMLYCAGIALAFVVVGHALERGFHLAGRPIRWAWTVALGGSLLVPAAAWLRPDAFAALPVPILEPIVQQASPVVGRGGTVTGSPTALAQALSLGDFDALLRWGWWLSSATALLVLAKAALHLASLRRYWRVASLDGRLVLVSRDVGPAVIGVLRPRVVVPEWSLGLPATARELMLAHEEQHLRAGDPQLLAFGVIALLIAPWNPMLWWQMRRLRLAVEMDCDARVLRQGSTPPGAYGELLLHVGQRRRRLPVGAAALGEPVSFLESRIRRMVTRLPRWRWAGAAGAIAIAVGAVGAACEAPRPVAAAMIQGQTPADVLVHREGVSSDDVRPLLTRFFGPDPSRLANSSVLVWFVVDRRGAVAARGTLRRQPADTVLSVTTARRIPGYDTLRVTSVLLHAERNLPPTIIARLGEPPVRLGSSPVRVVSDSYPGPSADDMRRLARTYHPEVFAGNEWAAVAVVIDAQGRMVGHAAGARASGDRTCEDVVKRLLPAFRSKRFSSLGCADFGSEAKVVVYWGQLRTP